MSKISFHAVSAEEKAMVTALIDELFGRGVGTNVIGPNHVISATGKRVELFLASDEILKVFNMTRGERNPYCLGLYLGDLVNKKWFPSIEGATLCSPYTDRKVKVTDRGEQAALYGRDIHRSHIMAFPEAIDEGRRVLVLNPLGETIALGKALIAGNRFSKANMNTSVVRNILDRGWYLRKGQ